MPAPKSKDQPRGTVIHDVQNGLFTYRLRARPLPSGVTAFLQANLSTIQSIVQRDREIANEGSAADLDAEANLPASDVHEASASLKKLDAKEFWAQLEKLFVDAGKEWSGMTDRIWAFGPRRVGPNIFVDSLGRSPKSLKSSSRSARLASKGTTPARAASPSPDTDAPTTSNERLDVEGHVQEQIEADKKAVPRNFDESFDTAFQLATARGPLCNEPIQGMAFFLEAAELHEDAVEQDVRAWKFFVITSGVNNDISCQCDSGLHKYLAVSSRQLKIASSKPCLTGRRACCWRCTHAIYKRRVRGLMKLVIAC